MKSCSTYEYKKSAVGVLWDLLKMSSVKLLILIVVCHQRVYAGNNHNARSAEVERVVADFLSLKEASDLSIKGMPRDSLKSVMSSHNISSEETVARQDNAVAMGPNSGHLSGNNSQYAVAVESGSDHMYRNNSQGEAALEPPIKPGSDLVRGNKSQDYVEVKSGLDHIYGNNSQGEAALEPPIKPGSDLVRGNNSHDVEVKSGLDHMYGNNSQGEAALESVIKPGSDLVRGNNSHYVEVESGSYRVRGNNSKDVAALESGSEVDGNYNEYTGSEKSSSNPSKSGDSNKDAGFTEEFSSNPLESSSSIVILYGNFNLSENATANFISIASDVFSISVP